MHLLPRVVAVALLGALAGAACLVGVAAWHPAVTFGMDRDLPRYATGFYPVERSGPDAFSWTGERAEVVLAGLDRRVPWTCEVRFRGARPSEDQQPELLLAVDGLHVGTWRATNDFQDVRVEAPPSPAKPGLTLSLTSSRVYEPGPSDPRRLGVQVEHLRCAPSSGLGLPPRRALGAAAASAALMGAGFAFTGIVASSAVGGAALMAIGQAFVLISGGGLYGPYPESAIRLAFFIALGSVLVALPLHFRSRERLRNTARFVITFSAGALYLQLLALLHPAKPLIDAVFHAHRFEAVLAGHLYFTQLSTSATPFPYAIGLYLFSVPWAFLTANHVALLRVVVSTLEVVAGGLLYAAVVKTWGNRLTGAIAAALFTLVPVLYEIIGNANLTNAFGQAVSVITMTTLAMQAERLRRRTVFAGLAVLATLGLISHISTLVLLTSALLVAAVLFRRFGGQALRGAGRATLLLTLTALIASTLIYWGHFGDVYLVQFQRLRAAVTSSAAADAADASPGSGAAAQGASKLGRVTIPLAERAAGALRQTADGLGWPIALLALVGAWRLFADGGRGRLDLVILAWGAVWLVFVSVSVLSTGNKAYQQDSFEFIGRVLHATMPAAALLAARAAAWGWKAGTALRTAVLAMLAWALVVGVAAWSAWLT